MEAIRAIKNKADLEGTAYVELLPGKYNNQCWNEGSLFFEEEVFGYMEAIISRHMASYDHYAFTEISAATWAVITRDFLALASLLDQAQSVSELGNEVGYLFRGSDASFAEGFQANKEALAGLLREVSAWIATKAREHGCVTVLGL